MSWGVGCTRGLDLAWLWLWCRPAAAAPIRPLAWEPPYAVHMALTKKPKKTRNDMVAPGELSYAHLESQPW